MPHRNQRAESHGRWPTDAFVKPIATLANGTKAVNIDGRFQSVMLARPNEDGTSELRCVTTFEEAAEFLGLVEDKQQ